MGQIDRLFSSPFFRELLIYPWQYFLPLFGALALIALVAQRVRGGKTAPIFQLPLSLQIAAAAIVVLGILWIPGHYLFIDKFADHGEGHVAAMAPIILRAQELYPPQDSPYDYGNFYGPVFYFVYAAVPMLLGPDFLTVKLPNFFAFVLTFVFLFLTCRRFMTTARAFIWTTLGASFILYFGLYPYHTRPDPLLLLCCSIAFWQAVTRGKLGSTVGLGITLGLLANIKIHGPLYLAPAVYIAARRFGLRGLFTAGFVSMIVALLPWAAPYVSLKNYVDLVISANDQGKDWNGVVTLYFPAFLFMSIPLALRWLFGPKDEHPTYWRGASITLFCVGTIASIIAAKPGAGHGHLTPLLLSVLYLAAPIWGGWGVRTEKRDWIGKAALTAYLICFGAMALTGQYFAVRQIRGNAKIPVVADLQRIEEKYAGRKIALGWGDARKDDTYHYSFYRSYFVWRGGPYVYDLGIRMDMDYVGIMHTRAILQPLDECWVDLWLIPKGERPFEIGGYMTRRVLYPEWFLERFRQQYRIIDSSEFYDIWECQGIRQERTS